MPPEVAAHSYTSTSKVYSMGLENCVHETDSFMLTVTEEPPGLTLLVSKANTVALDLVTKFATAQVTE
jgi:hypothetical protein